MLSIYVAVVGVYFLSIAAAMLLGSWRVRAGTIVLALFTSGLSIDVGLQFDPSKTAALASLFLLPFVPLDWFFVSRFLRRFAPFACWALAVWCIGYVELERDLGSSWARGSNGKPLVALCNLTAAVALIPVVYMSLRTRQDVAWFLTFWAKIAGASAGLALIQVGHHLATGSFLWGIFRAHAQFATVSIGGVAIQRANALAGEPKDFGMLMVVSLVMLLASWRTTILRLSPKTHMLVLCAVACAAVLSFSSGAYLVIGLYGAICVLRSTNATARRTAGVIGMSALAIAMISPEFVAGVYEKRVLRILDKINGVAMQSESARAIDDLNDDKEVAAAAYLWQHPKIALTGAGLGAGPFYYDELVPERFAGSYSEQNSGVSWAIWAFGIVGLILFVLCAWPMLQGSYADGSLGTFVREFALVVALSFIPMHVVSLMCLALAVSIAPGVRTPPATLQGGRFDSSHPGNSIFVTARGGT